MTYKLTPRADRLRVLDAQIARLMAERDRLLWAEEVGPHAPEPDPIAPDMLRHRTDAARRHLLAWSWTPEFAAKVARHGGPSSDQQDDEREAS